MDIHSQNSCFQRNSLIEFQFEIWLGIGLTFLFDLIVLFAVPNEAPVIVEAESTTATTIDLKWSEVTELNSVPLLGYSIVYKEIDKKFQADNMKSVPATPTEAVLEDLKIFTNYTIRVYAFTGNGNGVPSEAVSLRTQEDGKFIVIMIEVN